MELPSGLQEGGDDAQELPRGCPSGLLPECGSADSIRKCPRCALQWLVLLAGLALAVALVYQATQNSEAVVIVGAPSEYVDEQVWTPEESRKRGEIWDNTWRHLQPAKDWYRANDAYLDALLPRVGAGSRVLELSTGNAGSLARELAVRGPQAFVLGTDISASVVEHLALEHPPSSWPGLKFQVADSFNLQFPEGDHFDLVFEKAGMADICHTRVKALIRLLACVVTRAFDPEKGGVFISLVHTSRSVQAKRRGRKETGPCSAGLACAVAARPEFNCSVEDIPLRRGLWVKDSHLYMSVVRCGGVSPELARLGCDAAAMEPTAVARIA